MVFVGGMFKKSQTATIMMCDIIFGMFLCTVCSEIARFQNLQFFVFSMICGQEIEKTTRLFQQNTIYQLDKYAPQSRTFADLRLTLDMSTLRLSVFLLSTYNFCALRAYRTNSMSLQLKLPEN